MPISRTQKRRKTYRKRRPYKKTYKKGYTVARRGKRYQKKLIPRAPFPDYRFVRLKYAEVTTYTITQGTLMPLYVYQSSLFDPRYNIGGHQPLYFDQLSYIYKKYRVYGMHVRVKMTGNYDYGAVLGLRFTDTPTSDPNNLELFMERPDTIARKGYSYTQDIQIRAYKSVASTLGVPRSEVYTDDKYAAETSASPTNLMYASLYVYNFHPTNSQNYTVYTEIIYYAKFFDRITVAQS